MKEVTLMPAEPNVAAPPSNVSLFEKSSEPTRQRARERRQKLAKNLRQGLLILGLLGAALAAVLALRPLPVTVDVARAIRAPLVVTIEETGQTRVKDRYLVSAPTLGRLARITLEPGDTVQEGQTLAELSPSLSPLLDARTKSESEARLGAALSALSRAQAEQSRIQTARDQAARDLDKTKSLVASGALPTNDLEQAEFALRLRNDELASAQFAVKVASEEARMARAALDGRTRDGTADGHIDVLSPISGKVLTVHQKSAAVVQPGTPLLDIADPTQLEAIVDLLTTDAVAIKPGMPVEILGWGGDRTLPGRVQEIEPAAFTKPSALGVDEQRVNVIIALGEPRDQWAMLGDGYHVEVRLILWQGENVNQLPLGAVFRHGGGWATFKVEEGKARLTPIVVGHRGETEIEVVSGIEPGEMVIVHPGDRVKEGVRVEVE